MMPKTLVPLLCAVAMLLLAPSAGAQAPAADAEAMQAFSELVEHYRKRPALEVQSTLRIRLVEGEQVSEGGELEARITYLRDRGGVVKIRGFSCHFLDGALVAVHDETEGSYYREEIDGSPYWPLLINFQDIPYPHLAIFWGEASMDETCMQLQPQTPEIVPTALDAIVKDGKDLKRLTMIGPAGALRIHYDPKTWLINSMEHEVSGGQYVQAGAKRITTYTVKNTELSADDAAKRLAFDPGARQRVDLLASLRPPRRPQQMPEGPARVVGLAGQPAPALVLATADGGAVDLQQMRGKVVVIDFWATWCRPCVRALPLLHDVADWAKAEELPVEVLAVNVWETRDPRAEPDVRLQKVKKFWKRKGFTLPVAMDYSDETAKAWGVEGIPATFVVRSDGIVHAQHSGAGQGYVQQLQREIVEAIEALEAP